MTFPLVNDKGKWTTTWNLKLSFPVFLRNVLYTLGNVSDTAAEETIQPGDLKTLRPDTVVDKMEVFAPSAAKPVEIKKSPQGDFGYKDTERFGVYRASGRAANAASPSTCWTRRRATCSRATK